MSRPMISFAFCSASSGPSASLTPPALPRPPVSTCALTTTLPPMPEAARRAKAAGPPPRPTPLAPAPPPPPREIRDAAGRAGHPGGDQVRVPRGRRTPLPELGRGAASPARRLPLPARVRREAARGAAELHAQPRDRGAELSGRARRLPRARRAQPVGRGERPRPVADRSRREDARDAVRQPLAARV